MTPNESTPAPLSQRVPRRIGAVLAGLALIIILDTGLDVMMHATGVYPPWFWPMPTNLWLLALSYRTIDSIAGSYVTALLAPDRPLGHALFLGALGVIFSLIGVVATWNKGPEFGPKWYPIALVVIAIPCAFIGGTLRERQLK